METDTTAFEYNGKRLDETSFNELRSKNPGAVIVWHFLELPKDQSSLDHSVLFPGGAISERRDATVLVLDQNTSDASRMLELLSGVLLQVLQSEKRQKVTLDKELTHLSR